MVVVGSGVVVAGMVVVGSGVVVAGMVVVGSGVVVAGMVDAARVATTGRVRSLAPSRPCSNCIRAVIFGR